MENSEKKNKYFTFTNHKDIYIDYPMRLNAAHPKELVIFFRSEDQAEGKPCEGSGEPISTVRGQPWRKTELDEKYTQDFGFDLYRPELYGSNTKVASNDIETAMEEFYIKAPKNEEEAKSEAKDVANKFNRHLSPILGSTNETEDFEPFRQDILSYKLIDSEKKEKFINDKFKLKKESEYIEDYYLPNIMVMKGKSIEIYAKYFCTGKRKDVQAKVNTTSNEGLVSITQNIVFKKSEKGAAIRIVTDPNVYIGRDIIITISVTNSQGLEEVIGKCRLLSNKEVEAKIVFIDVAYNKVPVTNNYMAMLNNLNQKAFNQAGILLVGGKPNHTLQLNSNDQDPDEGKIASLFINSTSITNLHEILLICRYLFYESLAEELMKKIEVGLKAIQIELNGSKVSLITNNEKIEDILSDNPDPNTQKVRSKKNYNSLKDCFKKYLKSGSYSVFPVFILQDLQSSDPLANAKGFLGGRGVIIPKNEISTDVMAWAHELGHNFNLNHTHTDSGKADIVLPSGTTRENIMDYIVTGDTAKRLNFITFQWEIMQKLLNNNKTNVNDLQISVSNGRIVEVNQNSQLNVLANRLIGYICDRRGLNILKFSQTKTNTIVLDMIKSSIVDILNTL